MGESSIDPEIIKRTQDTLGQIISAPALTEKLLSRPPVQFLQDIVKAVCEFFFVLANIYLCNLGCKKNKFSSRIIFR
jgi:hypothetical protein